jgi:hypothetical protein
MEELVWTGSAALVGGFGIAILRVLHQIKDVLYLERTTNMEIFNALDELRLKA